MLTILEFCDKHDACYEGRKWALNNCKSMQEAWDKCPRGDWFIWIATRPNVLDDKILRLFAVWCCRQVQHLMKDPRSIAAVDAAEQFANGLISKERLAEKRQQAVDVYAAAAAAAVDAYAAAANVANVAYAAAANVAYAAAAAVDVYAAAAAANAYAAAANVAYARIKQQTKQMEYLRQNCKPNFD